MEYQDLTETIIGCAYRVYNKMGFGFLESVYEKCLLIELRKEINRMKKIIMSILFILSKKQLNDYT